MDRLLSQDRTINLEVSAHPRADPSLWMLALPSSPGRAPARAGARQPSSPGVTCSLMWHTARFCSAQEQDTRMNFSQFPAPPWLASPQNFSVPRASGICGRTGQERVSRGQMAATEGREGGKGLAGHSSKQELEKRKVEDRYN